MIFRSRIFLIAVFAALTIIATAGAGCYALPPTSTTASSATTDSHKQALDEAWDILFKDYVDLSKLDSGALSAAAIRGIVDELNDPYTVYLDPFTNQRMQESFQRSFTGIGATVTMRDDKIVVVTPIPGSPAEEAGIQSGDVILAIDGVSTTDMTLEEAVLRVRGEEGTSVTLTVEHTGQTAPVDIAITRAQVNLPSLSYEMRGDIAYIDIFDFSARTDSEFVAALQDIMRKGATGIILDERSNPGGYADTVIAIVSHFVKQGVVLYMVDNAGHETKYPVRSTSVTTDLPLVVLTDNLSASGSEALAGAIQDFKRGIVVGTTTYGKGSANVLNQLEDGSGLYVTIARWETPNRRRIEGKGITPDYQLDLKGDDLVQWAIDYLHSKAATGVANTAGMAYAQDSGGAVGGAVADASASGADWTSFLCNISALSRWSM